MRADRLLSVLLLLQTHGRMNSRELAKRLEVSERTIHRDMEALSSAGVPVMSERGSQGGWSLLEPYQTNLTGLNEVEIQALFLTTPEKLLSDLGLRQAYDAALIKLHAALPATQRQDAVDIRERILFDLPGWTPSKEDEKCFRLVQNTVLNDRCLRMIYERGDGTTVEREVDALGLVAKGQVWYLVGTVEGELRTFRISRIQHAELLDRRAERPPEFDLAAYWSESAKEFVRTLPRYPAVIRVHRDWVNRMYGWWRFARVQKVHPPDEDGWHVVDVHFEVLEEATGCVLAFGPYIKVVEPEELRQTVKEWARAVAGC